MSSYVFERIHEAASASDPRYLADQKRRWLSRKDLADVNLMVAGIVNVLTLGAKTFVVSIKDGDSSYFCFSGLAVPEQLPVNLEEADATPGLFASVVFCSELLATATASQARNILEQQYDGLDSYNGHELADILPLFPRLYFVKVIAESSAPYLKQVERVAGTYLAAGYPGHPLEIDQNLRLRLIALFEAGAETIPFSLPLQGLLAYSWPALFLDLYRCLEQLYTTLKMKSLVKKIPHTGSLADLAYLLEEELQWRPREQEALNSILALSTEETRGKIFSAFKIEASEDADYSPSKCAKSIYKLRNSHVHFRPAMKAEFKSSGQWNEIVIAMCDAVDDAYEALGFEFLRVRS